MNTLSSEMSKSTNVGSQNWRPIPEIAGPPLPLQTPLRNYALRGTSSPSCPHCPSSANTHRAARPRWPTFRVSALYLYREHIDPKYTGRHSAQHTVHKHTHTQHHAQTACSHKRYTLTRHPETTCVLPWGSGHTHTHTHTHTVLGQHTHTAHPLSPPLHAASRLHFYSPR